MEEPEYLYTNISDICRACCNNNRQKEDGHNICDGGGGVVVDDDDQQMFSIFDTQFEKQFLVDLLRACCPILQIFPNDNLPNSICQYCMNTLVEFYRFQVLCTKSDKKLRIITTAKTNESEESESITTIIDQQESFDQQLPNDDENVNTIKIEEVDAKSIGKTKTERTELDVKIECADQEYKVMVLLCEGGTDKEINNKEEDIQLNGVEDSDGEDNKNDDHQSSSPSSSSSSSSDLKRYDAPKMKRKCKLLINHDRTSPKLKITKRFLCTVCGKDFDKPYRLKRHVNVHNSIGKPHECDICKIRFVHLSSLERHSIKHTDILENTTTRLTTDQPKIYKCIECGREFAKQESLASHMRIHKESTSQSKEHICDICSKSFPKLISLNRHYKTHEISKSHKCNICDRTFVLGGQLIDHINKHRGLKSHVCPVCKKGFTQSCTLKDHLRTHSGETPYLCSECGKGFNNSSNLRQHLLRHTGDKPYACPNCPSRFSCKGGLKSHMITHTGLKPYVCDTCGSSFTKPYSLAKHKRIHTGERPYGCEMCDMRFNSSDHVKRHMRTHTGEKPYKCKYCERAFAQSNDLVKHTRSHVGDNTYQCSQCPTAFRLQSELRVHASIHYLAQQQYGSVNHNEMDALNDQNKDTSLSETQLLSVQRLVLNDMKSNDNNSIENMSATVTAIESTPMRIQDKLPLQRNINESQQDQNNTQDSTVITDERPSGQLSLQFIKIEIDNHQENNQSIVIQQPMSNKSNSFDAL